MLFKEVRCRIPLLRSLNPASVIRRQFPSRKPRGLATPRVQKPIAGKRGSGRWIKVE